MPTLNFNAHTPATGVSAFRPETYGAIRSGYTTARLATGGDNDTLQDTTQNWTVNRFQSTGSVYWRVVITAGTNAGESSLILSNTANTLTLETPLTNPIDATSRYFVAFDSSYAINECIADIVAKGSGASTLLSTGLPYWTGQTISWSSIGGWLMGEFGGAHVNKQTPPDIRWIGNAGGTMVECPSGGSYVQYQRMQYLTLRGMAESTATQSIETAAGIGVDFQGKLDHGSGFQDCWIKQVKSYPWYARQGGINVAMDRTRWDNNPYPARWDVIGGDSLWLTSLTGDDTHTTDLALGTARGLLYIDAEINSPGGGGGMFLSIRGATLEVHHELDPDYGIITYHSAQNVSGSSVNGKGFPQLFFDYDNCYGKPRTGSGAPTRWPMLKCDPPTDQVIIRHGTGYKPVFEGIPSYRTDAGSLVGPQTGLTAPMHPLMPNNGNNNNTKTVALYNAMIEHNGPLNRHGHRASAYEWVTFSGGTPTYDAGASRQVYSGEMFADVSELANGATGTTAIAICGTQTGGIAGGMLSDPALLTGVTATIVGTNNVVTLSSIPLGSDGEPVIRLGDMLLINGVTRTRIAEIDYADNTIWVTPTVPAGTGVSVAWLTPVWRTGTLATT